MIMLYEINDWNRALIQNKVLPNWNFNTLMETVGFN